MHQANASGNRFWFHAGAIKKLIDLGSGMKLLETHLASIIFCIWKKVLNFIDLMLWVYNTSVAVIIY